MDEFCFDSDLACIIPEMRIQFCDVVTLLLFGKRIRLMKEIDDRSPP